jgi:transcriptional regulator with XRE-family HTH domain
LVDASGNCGFSVAGRRRSLPLEQASTGRAGGIERGERNPTVLVLADIARALNVGIGDLFSGGKRGNR